MNKTLIKQATLLQEANVRECKVCKERKLRILYGKFPGMNNKYIDESGKLWSGRTCPPCNNLRLKNKMAQIRQGKKTKLGTELIDSLTEAVDAEVMSKVITDENK